MRSSSSAPVLPAIRGQLRRSGSSFGSTGGVSGGGGGGGFVTAPNLSSSIGAASPGGASCFSMASAPTSEAGRFDSNIFSRNWAPENKRLLHERRERKWLRSKAKHGYIDFSDSERSELKRYFDALCDQGGTKMRVDKLEDMLISLGLAETRQDVLEIVETLDAERDPMSDLDFEDYLKIVRSRTDSDIFPAMMMGKLGDRNLNFQTVISTYRRQLILDNMCERPKKKDQPRKGEDILQNFAALQKSRYDEAVAEHGVCDSDEILPFVATGAAPMGGLEMVWRGVVAEYGLASSRPSSAEGAMKRTLDPPKSPRAVIESILKDGKPQRTCRGNTIIVREMQRVSTSPHSKASSSRPFADGSDGGSTPKPPSGGSRRGNLIR
eukprot:TRINITY_DN33406_c0_g1_i1.p1 TRINITY_DN33406_c0_g1~~TRINITY_DN33406_c0_g1_i1.p1  ORF type:complete len:381 (-),score=74.21 TRINITY_DN33406_c0_g1_i1:144-1286(-)